MKSGAASFDTAYTSGMDVDPDVLPSDPAFYERPKAADLPSTLDIDYVRVWK